MQGCKQRCEGGLLVDGAKRAESKVLLGVGVCRLVLGGGGAVWGRLVIGGGCEWWACSLAWGGAFLGGGRGGGGGGVFSGDIRGVVVLEIGMAYGRVEGYGGGGGGDWEGVGVVGGLGGGCGG